MSSAGNTPPRRAQSQPGGMQGIMLVEPILAKAARKLGIKGVNVLTSPFLNTHRARIIKLAAAARLPAIYQWPETAEEGGLLGYGPRITEIYRQLAGYASRILKGASPAELPVEQPKKYELVINRRSARAAGITIPQDLLLRADRVID